MIGERRAIEAVEAGTTRDRIYGQVTHCNSTFTLIDAAGIENKKDDFAQSIKEQLEVAKQQADLFIFVFDAQEGLTNEDETIMSSLRKLNKPVIVVGNKADNPKIIAEVEAMPPRGFLGFYPTSAVHDSGLYDLNEEIIKILPHSKSSKYSGNTANIALIGRPNVGKSTLLNYLAGHQRSIVSDIAGTTRDIVDFITPYKEMQFRFIDTAGIRRSGKVEVGIEKFSVMRSVSAVEQSDVAVVLIDAMQGPTSGDAHIIGVALDYNKGLIIAVNKWDQYVANLDDKPVEEGFTKEEYARAQYLAKLKQQFSFVLWASVVFISAQTGENVAKLQEQIWKIVRTRQKKLTQEELESIKKEAERRHSHFPLVYALNQIDVNPPTFQLVINRPQTWHFSHSRFIENLIREVEPYNGTAIVLKTIAKSDLKK